MNINRLSSAFVVVCTIWLIWTSPADATCPADKTHFWLSPFATSPSFADVPVLNTSGTATIYLWGRLRSGEKVTDASFHLLSSSPIHFESGTMDNPVLGVVDGKTARRFEHTPEVTVKAQAIEQLQGFTLGNRATVGLGLGPDSKSSDPRYDAVADAWRLASITFSDATEGDMHLQIGANGILGRNSGDEATPEFSVVFGSETDPALCAVDALQTSSATADASTTSGLLEAARVETISGSYLQSTGAILQLELDGSATTAHDKLIVAHRAALAGTLELAVDGLPDPTEPGGSDRLRLITASDREGRFDRITYAGRTLVDRTSDPDRLHHHDGSGVFRTVSYLDESVELLNYQAVAGDVNGDYEVNFADFIVFSDNYSEAGDWTQGDFDGNGVVAFRDFLDLSRNFGTAAPPMAAQAVPEPRCQLLWLGVVLWWTRRRTPSR